MLLPQTHGEPRDQSFRDCWDSFGYHYSLVTYPGQPGFEETPQMNRLPYLSVTPRRLAETQQLDHGRRAQDGGPEATHVRVGRKIDVV